METISLVHSFFRTSNYFPLENNSRSRKKTKHKCVWWSCNNILKPLAIQCWEGFTQTTRFILFPGRTQKIVVNTDKMTEYFTVSVLTKQAGCLNIAPMRKSFYALSVKTRSGIYWRIEMCHDWEEVKSLKIQPWYIMRKLDTLVQGRSSLTVLDRTPQNASLTM